MWIRNTGSLWTYPYCPDCLVLPGRPESPSPRPWRPLHPARPTVAGPRSCCCHPRLPHRRHLSRQKGGGVNELTEVSRGLQRDVVYIFWPIAPSYTGTSPNAGGGMGSCGVSSNEYPYSCTHHETWSFGDLPPSLTYGGEKRIRMFFGLPDPEPDR